MTRSEHLPEFDRPPLDEVVLGIQFASVAGYQSVHSSQVWDLFRENYPNVQEQPASISEFETFGGTNVKPNFSFQIGNPIGSRLWFLSNEDSSLLQFQPDCFFANWRKITADDSYPRFDNIADSFEVNLTNLFDFFKSNFDYKIDINQAELTYVNIIPVDDFSEVSELVNIMNNDNFKVETIFTDFREIIKDSTGRPYARLKHEIGTVTRQNDNTKAIRFSLTFRGKPEENDIESAMKFLSLGRDNIVNRFDQMTTAKAHSIWGKK